MDDFVIYERKAYLAQKNEIMKKTKILAPALGILCLSMAASVTATVAWFSSNATVTAEGMTISAVTATNLFINNTTLTEGAFSALSPSETMINLGNAGKSVADITDTHGVTAKQLKPVSPINNFESYIYVADSTKVAMGGEIFSDSVPTDAMSTAAKQGSNWGGLVDYVDVGAVDLYLQDVEKREIRVTVTVTPTVSEKQALLPAVRVALRFDEDLAGTDEATMKTTIFSTEGRDDVRPLSDVTTIGEAQTTEAFGTPYTISETDGMVNNKTVRVLIFFYFEGQDGACITQNSPYSAGYEIGLSFAANA